MCRQHSYESRCPGTIYAACNLRTPGVQAFNCKTRKAYGMGVGVTVAKVLECSAERCMPAIIHNTDLARCKRCAQIHGQDGLTRIAGRSRVTTMTRYGCTLPHNWSVLTPEQRATYIANNRQARDFIWRRHGDIPKVHGRVPHFPTYYTPDFIATEDEYTRMRTGLAEHGRIEYGEGWELAKERRNSTRRARARERRC